MKRRDHQGQASAWVGYSLRPPVAPIRHVLGPAQTMVESTVFRRENTNGGLKPMRTLLSLTVVLHLAQWPPSGHGAEPKFEACDVFEFEEWIAKKGQPMQSGTTTFFTSAELPWTPLGPSRDPLTELQGFAAVREEAVLDFHGKKLQGMKITWKREPKQPANVPAAVIRFWVSNEVPTPPFPVDLEGRPQFWIPPGCVKFEIVAHTKQAKGVDIDEIQESFSFSGECKQATTYKAGSRSFKAHQFKYTIPTGRPKGNWTVTLSRDVPGGVCSMMISNDNEEGGIRLVAITAAPLPKKLETFAEAGFAFAPPDGYSRMKERTNGELVRFASADNAFIGIALVELRTLEALCAQVDKPPDGDPAMRLVSFSKDAHVAGSPSFDAADVKTGALYIFTEHAGRGYRIEISGLGRMEHDRVRSILRGWRWMTTQ
jgi:hypothetical protein